MQNPNRSRSSQRLRSIAAVGLAVAVAVGGVALRHADAAPATNASGLPWVSGGSGDSLSAFEAYRGRTADVAVVWGDQDLMSKAARAYAVQARSRAGYKGKISLAAPLISKKEGQTLATCASGANDGYYTAMAKAVAVEYGYPNAIVRPGWEASGSWYPWGVTNPINGTDTAKSVENYKECFRHFSVAFKAVSPSFVIDYNAGNLAGGSMLDLYPGDQYVDSVGNDTYEQWDLKTQANWDADCNAGTAAAPIGLCRYAEYARAHNKMISVPEWGLDTRYAKGADTVLFIQNFAKFFNQNADILAYEAYFTQTTNASYPCQFSIINGCNPAASAEYLKWFGKDATYVTTTTAPPTTVPPTTTSTTVLVSEPVVKPAYGLRYSKSADGSGSTYLASAHLEGDAYISYVPATPKKQVVFTVDGNAVRTEVTAPYDMGGSASQAAAPFDTTKLVNGDHVVAAVVTALDGTVETLSAKVTVSGGIPAPVYGLRYSTTRDGSTGYVPLDGATISGQVYISYLPATTKKSVRFQLDGRKVGAAEQTAPYDFGGTAALGGSNYDTSKLARGSHTVKATVTLPDGSTELVDATFAVRAG